MQFRHKVVALASATLLSTFGAGMAAQSASALTPSQSRAGLAKVRAHTTGYKRVQVSLKSDAPRCPIGNIVVPGCVTPTYPPAPR